MRGWMKLVRSVSAVTVLNTALVCSALAQTSATPVTTDPSASSPGASAAQPDPASAPPAQPVASPVTPKASGACFLPPVKVPDDKMALFLGNPKALLERNGGGGLPLANEVRGLAGSSAAAVPVLIDLAKSGNAAQQAAIGAGLARAALVCSRNNPDYAAMIQEAVAASGLSPMITAFVSASNDVQTAALGGAAAGGVGGGGAAGGIGGGGTAGGGSAGLDGSVTVAQSGELVGVNNPGNFFDNTVNNPPVVSQTQTP